MAVFGKGNNSFSTQTTIISDGAYIKGELILNSMLHIDGKVEGIINSDNSVVIGKKGSAKGVINAKKVVVNGVFEGNIDSDYVEILAGGILTGDVTSSSLSIEVGAKFSGKSSVKNASSVKSLENLEIIDIEESSAS